MKSSLGRIINEVCLKLSQAAVTIYKVRNLLSQEALMLIYHALVGQKLRYGLICWATASKFLLDKVDVAHNKVVRYLTFSKACCRAWPLYNKLVFSLVLLLNKSNNGIENNLAVKRR